MISSAGVVISQVRFGSEYYLFKHQLFLGVLPGLVIMAIVSRVRYQWWKKAAVPFFFLAVLFLCLVFIPGIGVRLQGASRWIQIGTFSFQPAEMMKLAIVLYLAFWIERRGKRLRSLQDGLLPFAVILTVVGTLIIKQPDMGTLGVIILIAVTIFFVAGVPLKHLSALGAAGIFLVLFLVKIEPYRMNRFTTFLNPQHDPRGTSYQINQALIAVGSGGVWGLGIGHSRQKFNYLPEPVGDSIFAVVAEELGMIGAGILLFLFLLFALRGFKIACHAPDTFSKLTTIGITSWVILQALINIAAIVGLIPLTGIPLPFISYGATSLVFILIGVGIVLNVSRHCQLEKG